MPSESAQAPLQVREQVAAMIEKLRPYIQSDGGDIELVGVTEAGVVEIRFQAACVGCPSSEMTLTHTIEANLKKAVPEVTSVVAVD